MASRQESVDVSITAALAKIGAIEKALAKATKATVTLNITAALNRVKTLDAALTKATSRRSLTFDTARAQAQLRALSRQIATLGNESVGGTQAGDAVTRATKARVLAQKASLSQIAAINREIAAAGVNAENKVAGARRQNAQQLSTINRNLAASARAAADQQVAVEQNKARQIQSINQRLAAFQRTQATAAQRDAASAASRSLATQRATLSAQLSQVRSLQNVGQQLTFGLTLPIAASAVALSRLGFQFEDTINRIRVLTTPSFRASSEAISQLRDQIIALGPETGRTPTELADGFYQIASAGVSGATALEVLKAAAQAATIGLGDTNVVADVATSVLNAYGSSAGNAFQITNTLAEAVRIAKGEASEFAPVIGRLLPVAKNLGISFADVAGSAALLTRNGLSASEATTQLRGLFNSFIKPSVQARKELDRVGLSSTQLLNQLRGGDFIGAIRNIRDAFGGDQLGLGRLFRNQQGLNAFLTLSKDLNATAAALREVREAGKGAADSVTGFDQIKNEPVVQFRIALADLQGQLLKIANQIAPVIVNIAKLAGAFTGFFNSLPNGAQFVIAAGLAIAALSGPFILAFTAMRRLQIAKQQLDLAMGNTTGIDKTTQSVGRLGTVMGGNAGNVTKFAGALGALAATAVAFQSGQGLANAADGGQKLASVLGIAGGALASFVAGSAVGGPIVGGLAAAATTAAGAIGFFGQQAKNQKQATDNFRDSLVGAKDAAEELARVTQGIIPELKNLLDGTDKLGQIEFRQLEDAGVNFADFGAAVAKGGEELDRFLKIASRKVAAEQIKEISNSIDLLKPKQIGAFNDEVRHMLELLDSKGLVAFDNELNVLGINSKKAFDVLATAAQGDLQKLSEALGIPINDARRLTELLQGASSGVDEFGAASADATGGVDELGGAAEGTAVSLQDLIAGLDTAIESARGLNDVKLDSFTEQVDIAAGAAKLFDVIKENKDVFPKLGEQFDLTTEAGRKQAIAAATVTDALKTQFDAGQKQAESLLAQEDGVNKAKFAYNGFVGQLAGVAIAAGVTKEQFDAFLTSNGLDPATVFGNWEKGGVTAAANVNAAVKGLLDSLPADAAAAVLAIEQPTDQVALLANQLSLLPDEKFTQVIAQVVNKDSVDAVSEVIQNLPAEKQAQVLATIQGKEGVDALISQIVDNLPDQKVAEAIVNTTGQTEMDNLLTAVFKLPQSRIAAITAAVNGTAKVQDLHDRIDGTKGKEVFVKANVSGTGEVNTLKGAVASLNSKTITVTTKFNTIQQGAGQKIIGRNPDGSPIFGRSGMVFGQGGVRRMAGGGVISGVSRQPMIVRQRAAQGILWGEPETMGEAYISYAKRFRDRSRRILSRVAADFGMMVVPRQMAAGGIILDRRTTSGGFSDAQFRLLTQALGQKESERSGPVIGQVVVETQAQTPQAFAVEAVGALGLRLQERLAGR